MGGEEQVEKRRGRWGEYLLHEVPHLRDDCGEQLGGHDLKRAVSSFTIVREAALSSGELPFILHDDHPLRDVIIAVIRVSSHRNHHVVMRIMICVMFAIIHVSSHIDHPVDDDDHRCVTIAVIRVSSNLAHHVGDQDLY